MKGIKSTIISYVIFIVCVDVFVIGAGNNVCVVGGVKQGYHEYPRYDDEMYESPQYKEVYVFIFDEERNIILSWLAAVKVPTV